MHTKGGAATRFVQEFARNSAEGNLAALVAQFADTFLYAGPQGSQWVRTEDFVLALPKRKETFESFGHKRTELVEVQETWLDDRYTMVRTRWRFIFERESRGSENLETESSFLVDAGAEAFRILAYIPHQDIMQMLAQAAG